MESKNVNVHKSEGLVITVCESSAHVKAFGHAEYRRGAGFLIDGGFRFVKGRSDGEEPFKFSASFKKQGK